MAARRMFAKTIIDSDAFIEMPLSAQALYFHLAMRADDDGFINNHKNIQRMLGASGEDLELLIANNFIITFESGIIVIRHWKVHNYIQSDRYKPTRYVEEKALLEIQKTNEYVLNMPEENDMDTKCIHNVSSLDTQVRLGKVSLGKVSINNISCAPEPHDKDDQLKKDFETIYALYPKKVGKTNAFIYYKQWVGKGKNIGCKKHRLTNRQIYLAVKKYIRQQEEAGKDDYQYWKNFDTLMGRQLLDYVESEEKDEQNS